MLKIPIVLASASTRRAELLKAMDLPFRTIHTSFDEQIDPSWSAKNTAQHLARQKNLASREQLRPGEVLLTADTTVILNDLILHKPRDRHDAIQILQTLSGGWHEVITGVCMYRTHEVAFSVSTRVLLEDLSQEAIEYYIDQYKPYDKAGAYGIQEWMGWSHIQRIEGSFSNVMGLPTSTVYRVLVSEFGEIR